MITRRSILLLFATSAIGGSAGLVYAQGARGGAAGPIANYWITAETMSGFGAGMMGRSPGSMVGAMMSGRGMGGTSHVLRLQLGSTGRAADPTAEHLPPAGLGAGPSLPLVTPRQAAAIPEGPGRYGPMERPKGRMLIFWGCGEHAAPGQPVVVDFSKLAAGQMPPIFNAMNIQTQTPPSPGRYATYGEWPNERSRATVPANGSLVGAHVVRGNYIPEIHFSLAPGQDFLPALQVSSAPAGSGATVLNWRQVAGARAYFAMSMGASEEGNTFVLWSSSAVQAAAFGLDYMSEAELGRLVGQRVLMSLQTTQCAIPAEAIRAMPHGMLTLTAFGPEANFAYPPRPANARAWTPQWTVKLRTKSINMSMVGVDMPQMGSDGEEGRPPQQQGQPQKKKKKGLLGSLPSMPF